MSDLVLYEHRGTAAVVTINRPEKRNALSRELIAALDDAFARAATDAAARCVLFAATGPVFCAGMDLGELQATMTADREEIWDDAFNLAQLYERVYRCPKPTVALVQGSAIAGGAGLVSVCDLAITVPTAKFGYPEVRRGLVAALVMPHLLRHVGERMARYLLLTGELIDAEAALREGFVNEIVPADRLVERGDELARSLAEGGPIALKTTKELLAQFSQQALSVEEAARESAAPRLTDECQHGLAAFFSKTPPPWMAGP